MEKDKKGEPSILKGTGAAFRNRKTDNQAKDLIIANKALAYQNEEKEKRAAELFIANKELAYQNHEKEMRAAELLIANQELAFQNEEKEKRAAELIIANKELILNNFEKEKRAAELLIANQELSFQNKEKEKRSAELILANKELHFQNIEKEKRAAELTLVVNELIFQNEEKEKRAAELSIANKELAYQNEEKEKRAAELLLVQQKVNERTEQLESANHDLESFSYSVSHDLRAPLRAIHGYTRILLEEHGTQLDAEARMLMNKIMINGNKMGQLIEDLLSFSRLNREELVSVPVSMQNLVADLCNEQLSEQHERALQFDIKMLAPALGDLTALKQVWVNLISNAVKFSKLKATTHIEIASQIKENEIIYNISDNGAGFDMRYMDKLFTVFQRLHSDENYEGTGVGLAIVQRIVLKHGGRVWATGKLNEGATFFFTLPFTQ